MNVSFLSTAAYKFGPRGPESRQKTGWMLHFCLPDSPNSTRAVSKVDKNRCKCLILSTAAYKFGLRGPESRTKSPKIRKMFYSVTFAKAVWSQITGKSQKSRFARNRSQVQWLSRCWAALHLAKSLSFTDKSLKMGMLSVNGLLKKWRLRTKWSKTAGCP